MMKVANRKIIHKLTLRSFKANRIRNIMAILAIILTTVLFTTIFTVVISMNYSIQQQYMRMVGGYSHGGFKNLTKEQVQQLRKHPLIKESGSTLILSFPQEAPFNKHHTEIRYGDNTGAKMFYSYPTTGRMPKDKTELATDTAVLDLLGIPHKIGEKVTISYPLGKETVTDTFTLCGFWKTDEAMLASQIWLADEYVEEKLADYVPGTNAYDGIGKWSLDVMFSDSRNIDGNLSKVAEDNGYTVTNKSSDKYLNIGVNWAYTSTHAENGSSFTTIAAAGLLLVLITFTGYLIIYNIFQISVANDIRFYGLLKTIGTTSKQIKRIVRNQSLILSGIGIPFGLLIGFLIGSRITPVIMNIMTVKNTYVTLNPWIFAGAAAFSLMTVALSVRKPGKMAAGVSPIEAVRYSEGNTRKKKIKNSMGGAGAFGMAKENLKLNTKKTVLVIISLSLSVVLLNVTYTFSKGFSMDKFLKQFVVSDYIVGSSDYFQSRFGSASQKVTDSIIEQINAQEGVTESGRIYGSTFLSTSRINAGAMKKFYSQFSKEFAESMITKADKDGMAETDIDLYGLEDFPMKQLKTVEGELDLKKMKSGRYIAQVVFEDDYGKPVMDGAVHKVGDKMTVHYCNDFEYSEDGQLTEHNGWDAEYEVIAVVLMPNVMTVRSYGSPQYILSADTFKADTKSADTMIYMYNVKKENQDSMDSFLKNYTQKAEPNMGYESKKSQAKQFISFRNMFLLVGTSLSLIIGMVGILNFINAEITGIMTRRREFAMLQSIGMTGKQLKKMLIYEGILYGIISLAVSLAVSTVLGLFAVKSIENILWFFSFRFTITPIIILLPVFLLLGVVIPLAVYKATNRKSIVERLREAE